MRKYFVLFVTVMLVICAYIVGLNVGHEDGYTDAMNDYDYEYIYNDGYAHGYWDGIMAEEDSSGSWHTHEIPTEEQNTTFTGPVDVDAIA